MPQSDNAVLVRHAGGYVGSLPAQGLLLSRLVVCLASFAPVAFCMAKSGLGKGLGALISSRPALSADATAGEKIHRVKRDQIVPSPMQPRREFAEEALGELVNSIRQHGIIQPLIVRS